MTGDRRAIGLVWARYKRNYRYIRFCSKGGSIISAPVDWRQAASIISRPTLTVSALPHRMSCWQRASSIAGTKMVACFGYKSNVHEYSLIG